jgi:hypothetical protein
MTVQTLDVPLPLYETDETAWLEHSADLLRTGRLEELDSAVLAEYLTDMAISDRREVTSRLIVLLMHLLKWEFQPEGRCGSWLSTILEQQRELRSLMESGTLFNHAGDVLPDAYSHAIKQAAAETKIPRKGFPSDCPWNLETMLIDPVIEE